jgi:hypothetical protein
MTVHYLEKMFAKYFQRHITIRVGNDEIKSGKFLLIQNNLISNNFYFDLAIENTKKIVIFNLPFPFAVDEHESDGLIYLDYRFNSLTHDPYIINKLHQIKNNYMPEKPSKFLDSVIEIQFN